MNAHAPQITEMARGLRLGRAALEAGTESVLERFGPSRADASGGSRPSHAVMAALLELRGAAHKVAQFLSLESDVSPDFDVASHSLQAPVMGPAFVLDTIRADLGRVEKLFSDFTPTPFACASLGQVHAATTLDGQEVAVKVQYPGMSEVVRADMRLLRRAAGMLPHRAHYEHLLVEVGSRLQEECDYVQEAQALEWFDARLSIEGVTVAKVFPSLSSSRVVTMARLPGLHLDAWLVKQPGQSARDFAAQRLHDVFMQSVHVLGRIHADPNPGNILFGPEGQVGLIDFGCTRWIPDDCQDMIVRIWRAAATRDDEAAHAVYLDMGLFADLSTDEAWHVDRSSLLPFREWLAVPLLTERFDFGERPEFVAEGRKRFVRMLEDRALSGIRPEFVLVNRTLYGLYRLFERICARVRCQAG